MNSRAVVVTSMLAALLCCGLSGIALAAPYSVQVAEVEMNNSGLYIDANGSPQPAIFVRGVFTPALPCAQQGFFLTSADPFLQETLAIILTAKASGAPLGFTHVYCHSSGYSRGSTISAQQ